jgi:hypothetical protein
VWASLRLWVRSHAAVIGAAFLLAALLAKFLTPLVRFPLPLGYDPGIYRFLFVRYSGAFPLLPDLPRWAGEHPPGLFLLVAPLVQAGFPVDWLIGWVWSLMPVVLAVTLAAVWSRREGACVGILVLLAALLSQAYYDGFVGMYWKTYAALLLSVLTLAAIERRSPWAVLGAFLALVTHHQTGLLLGLVLASWFLVRSRAILRERRLLLLAGAVAVAAIASLLLYLPHWTAAVRDPLTSIFVLRGAQAPGGSFPDPVFYLRVTGILFAFGVYGFVLSLTRERGSVWQLAVLWTLPFILLKLVFYRRFYLQFDFFLLPFVALGVADVWRRYGAVVLRLAVGVLLVFQMMLSLHGAWTRAPEIDGATFSAILAAAAAAPEDAPVIALDSASAPWLLGWRTGGSVGGPGLFDLPGWTYPEWEQFLYGGRDLRRALLGNLPRETLFLVTPLFRSYYGEHVQGFFADPCLREKTQELLEIVCDPSVE